MKTNEAVKTALHFIPGDGPNGLIQAISMTTSLKVKILTLYTIDETVQKFCTESGIEIESLGFTEKNLLKQIFEFLKYLYKEKPKLIFAHSFYPSLICAVGRLFYWKAVFVPVRHHNRVHILSKNRKAIFLDQWISRVTSHTVGVSDAVRETLVEQGCKVEKISVIYNGLPSPVTHYSTKLLKSASEPYKLVALGRIDWQKDYEVMLKIVYELRRGGMDLVLTILGGGNQEYLETLKKLQGELGLLDCVSWLGRQPDIYEYLDEADLFIHTALDEACPLVLIETLMYGIPIVSSNLGGSRDVLEGFYDGCNPHNIDEFCHKITDALVSLDQSKDYALKITDSAIERFSPIRMQLEYTELSLKLFSQFKV
jgi:glycosyltransferase involved in cell wall biosynthesis